MSLTSKVLLIALVYFVTGKFGQLWTIETGYATAVWPPSGIALAAILLLGYRCWPGIFLGCFITHINIADCQANLIDAALLAPLSIAFGASLQAGAGAFLIRRTIGSGNPLIEDRSIIRFFLLGGPVSCLISASIATSTLYFLPVTDTFNPLFHWFNWWAGDCIGVFIFTPLLLSCFAKPRELWLSRKIPIAITLGFLFILNGGFHTYIQKHELSHQSEHFKQQTFVLQHAIKTTVDNYLALFDATQNFFIGSDSVNRQEFNRFARYFLKRQPDIQALEWITVVPAGKRLSYENTMREQGIPEFQITEKNSRGEQLRAGNRHVYYPVTYRQPNRTNENVLGYDLGSKPDTMQSLLEARVTGHATATERLMSGQEKAGQWSVSIYLPVHDKTHNKAAHRDIEGFVLGMFRIRDIVRAGFGEFKHRGIHLQIMDKTTPSAEQVLYSSIPDSGNGASANTLRTSYPIEIDGRTWQLIFSAAQTYLSANPPSTLWWSLALQVLIAGLISNGVMLLTGRNAHTEKLIAERTAELKAIYRAYPDLQFVLNSSGEILDYQASDLSELYLPPERFLGKKMQDVLPSEIGRQFSRAIARCLETRSLVNLEYSLPVCGKTRDFEARLQPMNDARLVIIARDITLRKQAERAIKKNEQLLQAILNNASAVIYLKDLEGKYLFVNHQYETLFHIKNKEFLGRTDYDIFPDELADKFRVNDQSVVSKGVPVQFEETALQDDGLHAYISIKFPLFDQQGEIYAVCGISTDITDRKRTEQRLQESRQRFEQVINISPAVIYTLAPTGNPENPFQPSFISEAIERLSGYKVADWYNTKSLWLDHLHPADKQAALDAQQRLLVTGRLDHQYRFRHKNGTYRWIHDKLILLRDDQGAITEVIGAWMDISHLKESEISLRKLQLAVEQSANVVIITDIHGAIEYVNKKVTDITGYLPDELLGKTLQIFRSPETPVSAYQDLWQTIRSGKTWRGILHNRKKSGQYYWSQESIAPVINNLQEVTNYVAIQEDVTKARQLSEKLTHQATHDPLTNLINRQEFERRLDRVINTAQQQQSEHALCYLDLDQFKIVNDSCSHAAGDELLRQLSSLLAENIRKRDTLGRLGGDEFAILMEHCSLSQAERTAEKILAVVEQFQFHWENRIFRIGVSIGLVPISAFSGQIGDLLTQADMACYMAKDAGRNRIQVYRKDDQALTQRHGEMHWVTKINQALQENRFLLYAQPIIPLNAEYHPGIHCEILLRKVTPDGKIISPGTFLPAAERYHLAPKLDRWVIHNTFQWFARHPQQLEHLSICSINLSGQNLGDTRLLDYIIRQFEETAIPHDKICFEITETSAIYNLFSATDFIRKLNSCGCKFSIDDFGSGLSSFDYLKNLPVDFLKIDGMFIKDILDDPVDLALVKSINEIGHVMGKRTIAEFVENEKILACLKKLGVDFAQGYHIGKPLPLESLPFV